MAGGYSNIWAIQGCAAQQGVVLPLWVWNRVHFLPCDSGTWSGLLFCCQNRAANERCCSCSHSASCCMFTQTRCFQFEGQLRFTFFQSVTGYLFSPFCLEQGSKIVSLQSGTGSGSQVLSGTPHPKFRGVTPRPGGKCQKRKNRNPIREPMKMMKSKQNSYTINWRGHCKDNRIIVLTALTSYWLI